MKAFITSMQGRVFLVVIGGIVASALLTASLSDREGRQTFAQVRAAHTADRVEQLVSALEAVPPEFRPTLAATLGRGMSAQFAGRDAPPQESDAELTDALVDELGQDRNVRATQGTPAECATPIGNNPPSSRLITTPCRVISLTLRDGTPLRLVLLPEFRASRPRSFRWLVYGVVFLLCLGLLAYFVARMTTRPLGGLARAATALGRDINQPPLPENGPSEVRHAAAAFNLMQARIRSYVEERTEMLAAIAHDLQTPLTRLRLRLEKVTDETLRGKLVADLGAMELMIREGLDLATSLDTGGVKQRVDLDSLLSSVCADAIDAGQNVTLSGEAHASVLGIPIALQRCLANLIDNAVKYGGYARVVAEREGDKAVIRVRDGGPGIPEAQMERVFDPYYRVETSRSRETGGTGLGLTIARNIAHKHGATLVLCNAAGGGLECTLTLPLNG
ncbi:MAG: HAMP domain-containing protein [Betaproteobacteria bacterium]|nr:MAG: HAMP domain-containing protein [Betaproteobacteria bacterium]